MTTPSKTKLWAGVLGIFLLGAVCGSAATGLFVKHRVMNFLGGNPAKHRAAIANMLTRELALNTEQRSKMEQALEIAQSRLFEIRRQHRPELRAILDDLYHSLQPNVPPERLSKLEDLYRRAERRLNLDPFAESSGERPNEGAISDNDTKELPSD